MVTKRKLGQRPADHVGSSTRGQKCHHSTEPSDNLIARSDSKRPRTVLAQDVVNIAGAASSSAVNVNLIMSNPFIFGNYPPCSQPNPIITSSPNVSQSTYINTRDTLNSSTDISPISYPPIKEVLQAIQAAGGDSELYDIDPDVLAEKFEVEGFTTVDQVPQISTNILRVVGFPLVLEEMLRDRAARLVLLEEGAGVSQPHN